VGPNRRALLGHRGARRASRPHHLRQGHRQRTHYGWGDSSARDHGFGYC
jgi:hypothetical protein